MFGGALFIFLLINVLEIGNGARILGVFPSAAVSHQVVFRGLTLTLNKRGHELVVITTHPLNDSALKNYREIDIETRSYDTRGGPTDWAKIRNTEWADFFWSFVPFLTCTQSERILANPEVKRLYEPGSNEKFDLIIIEHLYWSAFLPLGKIFDAPVIGITSMSMSFHVQYSIGNPILPSHQSNWEILNKDNEPLTLWRRLVNFVKVWKYIYDIQKYLIPKHQEIAKKYFGENVPDITELEKNISLVFVNQQTPISYVKANVPKYIEIGGFHVSDEVQELPTDLKKSLDEATQGFVYMSLGSNVKSNTLSDKMKREFNAAFSKLPYKVIWKFEDDVLPGKPDNVIIMKWTPQQAILAHPNLKVFIYQGGLQSTEEATSHGVPLIGLPVVADQEMQVNKLVSLGVAKKLEISTIRSDDLLEAINTIATDNRYKERMLNLRSLLKDKPQDAMKNAIWWTEFVIRHRGAPQLHSTTADQPWYSRYDMDLIAILSAGSVVAIFLILVLFYKSLVYSISLVGTKSDVSKKSSAIKKKKRN